MKCNVGKIERPIRIVLGLILIAIGSLAELPIAGMAIALVAGSIALVTGVIGFCPAWALLGINTCGSKSDTGKVAKPA
ncbi:MAG TPA: DUF2892 domain-containing protein [Nitrospiraceae bacterium]|nr:DUF2892 domain-containing protein [Nitrospiraceae bacterium]